jgi:hypothetical protein
MGRRIEVKKRSEGEALEAWLGATRAQRIDTESMMERLRHEREDIETLVGRPISDAEWSDACSLLASSEAIPAPTRCLIVALNSA